MTDSKNLHRKQGRTGIVAADALQGEALATDNDGMEIGHVIRTLRQEQGLTLEELALRIGSDAGNLSRVERGKQRYTPEMLQAIADALQTPISHLFVRAEQKVGTYEVVDKRIDGPRPQVDSDFFITLRKTVLNLDKGDQLLVIEFARLLQRQARSRRGSDDASEPAA